MSAAASSSAPSQAVLNINQLLTETQDKGKVWNAAFHNNSDAVASAISQSFIQEVLAQLKTRFDPFHETPTKAKPLDARLSFDSESEPSWKHHNPSSNLERLVTLMGDSVNQAPFNEWLEEKITSPETEGGDRTDTPGFVVNIRNAGIPPEPTYAIVGKNINVTYFQSRLNELAKKVVANLDEEFKKLQRSPGNNKLQFECSFITSLKDRASAWGFPTGLSSSMESEDHYLQAKLWISP